MKKYILCVFIFLITCIGAYSRQEQNLPKIQQIKIEGRKQIGIQTYMYYIQSKTGDIYDEDRIKADFKRLWDTELLLDLKMDVSDGKEGKIVTFTVTEKPKIKEIHYRGQKKLNISDITKTLEDKKISLRPDDLYDPVKSKEVETAIHQLLKEKGFRMATVKSNIVKEKEGTVTLDYAIDEGESLRIGYITFAGNNSISQGKLLRSMKKLKKHNWLSWLFKKDKLDQEKMEEDVENIKDYYFNHGYINIKIGEPVIGTYAAKTTFTRKNIKRLKITFPVEEGDKHYFGDVTLSGNKVIAEKKIHKMINFKKGDVFSRKKIKDLISDVQEAYGEKGYLFAAVEPVPTIDNVKKLVNLEMKIMEDNPQYIRRLDFKENTYTLDKVLRREMKLQEGDLLKISTFRKSLDNLNRTGFFDKVEPDIKRVEKDQSKVDVAINLQENKRNEIRVGGGYSQLEKFFGTIAFSTRNLFGTGKIFDMNIQGGKISSIYSLGLTDPYFMDSDFSLGINAQKSKLEYFIFNSNSIGGNLLFGFPIFEEVKALFAYGYQVTHITNIIGEATSDQKLIDYYKKLFGTESKRIESVIIPQVYRTTFNNPIDPTAGMNISLAMSIAGGYLGGNVNLLKPIFKYTHYFPIGRRPYVFAYNFELGYARGFSGKALPVFERYFLGGEYSIRGYDIRTVGPIDPKISTVYSIGGDKYIQFNLEYQVPIAGPVKVAAFLDGGNAFDQRKRIDLTDLRYSTGFEFRVMAPFFNAPIRFIYAINFNRGPITVDRSSFRFAIGRTF